MVAIMDGGISEERTSEEVGTDTNSNQSDDTQEAQISEQTGNQASESFTSVDITSINRDNLTPEMQPVYDQMLEMHGNMNRDYTQNMQGMSQDRNDAELWRQVQSHPELAQRMGDMLYKYQNNIPLDEAPSYTPEPKPVEQTIDPEADPMGHILSETEKVVKREVAAALQPLMDQMAGVSGYVRGNQAQQEFDNLVTKHPVAGTIGMARLDSERRQYSDASGHPISMEKALHLMAVNQPGLLQKQETQKPRNPAPFVEKPVQTGAGREDTPLPEGIRGLQKRAEDRYQEQGGKMSLLDDLARAVKSLPSKLRGA